MLKRGVKMVWGVFGFIAICAAMIAVVMLLWNILLPEIFGLPAIGYWQAAGLMILLRLLFGGFGHGRFGKRHCHPGFHRFHKRFHDAKETHIHDRMHNHMHKMSFNERREFIRKCMCGDMEMPGVDPENGQQKGDE